MNPAPFPSDYTLVPRRKRRRGSWLLLPLVAAAAVLLALTFRPPHAAAARPAAVFVVKPAPSARPSTRPGVTVSVGRAVYACTAVVPKARH